MFRIFPHRAFIEPRATVAHVDAAAGAAVATLAIEGLLCSRCATNVSRRLESVDGVQSARVDLERGTARVAYDPARTTARALAAAVESAVLFRPIRRLFATLRRPPPTCPGDRAVPTASDSRP